MKKIYYLFTSLIIAFLATALTLSASESESGEGKDFWFAIPNTTKYVYMENPENASGAPNELHISSLTNNTVRIYYGTGALYRTVTLNAYQTVIVVLPDASNIPSETVCSPQRSYHVESDNPISLVVRTAWKYTGESFKALPTELLGKKYYSFNLYSDWFRALSSSTGNIFNPQTDMFAPAQIVIVATQDNTIVTYVPTVETDKVAAYKSCSVSLQKGEVYIIQSKTFAVPKVTQMLKQDGDLTGTYITSNKNIAVFSGHTRGSYPGMPMTLTNASLSVNCFRNTLIDPLLHNDLLGDKYIFVPSNYFGARVLIPSDQIGYKLEGDLVRIIAVDKGITTLRKTLPNGENIIIGALKTGDVLDLEEEKVPCMFYADSNKKFAVAQFGKAYWHWTSGILYKEGSQSNNKDEELQDWIEHAGAGRLTVLVPNNDWGGEGGFICPSDFKLNCFTIIFKEGSEKRILIRKEGSNISSSLYDSYGEKIKRIPGSECSYITASIPAGSYFFETSSKNDRDNFALYVYGTYDIFNLSRSYGFSVVCKNNIACSDSVVFKDTINCNIINGAATDFNLTNNSDCALISNIYLENYQDTSNKPVLKITTPVDKSIVNYSILFPNITKQNHVDLVAMTKSGAKFKKTYYYMPQTISVKDSLLDFGNSFINQSSILTTTITNISAEPLVIKDIILKQSNNLIFSILEPKKSKQIIIDPGNKLDVKIKASISDRKVNLVNDELALLTNCDTLSVCSLKITRSESGIETSDADFGYAAYLDGGQNSDSMRAYIKNIGRVDLLISKITREYANNAGTLSLSDDLPDVSVDKPLKIKSGEKYYYTIQYKLKNKNAANLLSRLIFSSNASNADSVVNVSINTTDNKFTLSRKDFGDCRAIDNWSKTQNISSYKSSIVFKNNSDRATIIDSVYLDNKLSPFGIDSSTATLLKNYVVPSNDSVKINIVFSPTGCGDFKNIIGIKGKYENLDLTALNSLTGRGVASSITSRDLIFGALNLANHSYVDSAVVIIAGNVEDPFSKNLIIDSLSIEGEDASLFKIKSEFLNLLKKSSLELRSGDSLFIPIRFEPGNSQSRKFTAKLKVYSDANLMRERVISLEGTTQYSNVMAKGFDFGKSIVSFGDTNGIVTLDNNQSESIYLKNTIDDSFIQTDLNGAKTFEPKYAYLESNSNKRFLTNELNIEIPPHDKLIVKTTFIPTRDFSYSGDVKFEYSKGKNTVATNSVVAAIKGSGAYYDCVAELPKDIICAPGEAFGSLGIKPIRVKLFTSSPELMDIYKAPIDCFEVKLYFPKNSSGSEFYLSPVFANQNDIILDGAMASNYTISSYSYNDGVMDLSFKNKDKNAFLNYSQDSALFYFLAKSNVKTNVKNLPFALEFIPSGECSNFMRVSNIQGSLTLDSTAKTLDVENDMSFSFETVELSPNPARDFLKLNYKLNKESRIKIDILNNLGESLCLVQDEFQQIGEFSRIVNLRQYNFAEGSYLLRVLYDSKAIFKPFIISK
jgi:hypothetical protein